MLWFINRNRVTIEPFSVNIRGYYLRFLHEGLTNRPLLKQDIKRGAHTAAQIMLVIDYWFEMLTTVQIDLKIFGNLGNSPHVNIWYVYRRILVLVGSWDVYEQVRYAKDIVTFSVWGVDIQEENLFR